MLRKIPLLSLAAVGTLALPVSAQQEVHVHGLVSVDLVFDQGELQIELAAPADSIVGFEHEARTAAEKETIAKATEMLRDPALLFDLPTNAACELHEVEVGRHREEDHDHDHDGHDEHDEAGHAEHDEEGHEEHEDHDQAEHGEHEAHGDEHAHEGDAEAHSEFHAHYHFDCEGPSVETIGLRLFETWPRIETVRVQALTPGGQTGGNFTRNDPVIRLP